MQQVTRLIVHLPSPLQGGVGVRVETIGPRSEGYGVPVSAFEHDLPTTRSDFATPTRLGLRPSPPSPQGGGK
jgi:hypothetical protein